MPWSAGNRGDLVVFSFWAVVLVALATLLLQAYFTIARPAIALYTQKESFVQAATACAQAKRHIGTSDELRDKVPERHREMLLRSFQITKLPCDNYQILREALLSKGVSKHKLKELYLLGASKQEFAKIAYDTELPLSLDVQLRKVIRLYGLSALPLKKLNRTPKYRLGQVLFHDPILSGRLDRSCATCHQDSHATADGLKVENRITVSNAKFQEQIPERNVPDLWNRDHNAVANMLWDGRLEMLDPVARELRVPKEISTVGYENLMAVQSVLPLVKPVEMLGDPNSPVSPLKEDFPDSLTVKLEKDKDLEPHEILDAIILRLVGSGDGLLAPWQEEYADLFEDAYGISSADGINASHIGNALAHFIELTFQSRNTPWDQYLKGDTSVLSKQAKQGALLFYGIGRCSICHSGDLFSDFSFHSVGVPNPDNKKDLGRFYATGNPEDRYKFRTPPLRNVTLTAPYFHNGFSENLTDSIVQHISPYRHAKSYTESGAHLMRKDEIDSISPLVGTPNYVSKTQVALIIEFLHSLEDSTASRISTEPKLVPSLLHEISKLD